MAEEREVTIESIRAAHEIIRPFVHRTPVMTSETLRDMAGFDKDVTLFFKCENFQKIGAFKARGACNAVHCLPDEITNVVTHSSGNHAQALAWAARTKGVKAHIVMPSNADKNKIEAVKGYGAEVYLCAPTIHARATSAEEVVQKTGGVLIHPSENIDVHAGQGTVGIEIMEQVKELLNENAKLDIIVVPIGGGGLISGIATAVKAVSPETIVIAAEPEIANDAFRSKETGQLCKHIEGSNYEKTIADGLKTTLGPNTFKIVMKRVDHVLTVSETEIAKATRLVWERMKLVIEPSAGVGIGVVLYNEKFKEIAKKAKNIGIIFCGGNLNLRRIPGILEMSEE